MFFYLLSNPRDAELSTVEKYEYLDSITLSIGVRVTTVTHSSDLRAKEILRSKIFDLYKTFVDDS